MVPICRPDANGNCKRCGLPIGRKEIRFCGTQESTTAKAKLGDRVEKVFKAVGIPTCGGCAKRKAALNKVSDWWRGESTPARQSK